MDTYALRPGDTVRLRSGGPLMTVKGEEDGGLAVLWFDEGVQAPVLRVAVLPPECLDLVPDD